MTSLKVGAFSKSKAPTSFTTSCDHMQAEALCRSRARSWIEVEKTPRFGKRCNTSKKSVSLDFSSVRMFLFVLAFVWEAFYKNRPLRSSRQPAKQNLRGCKRAVGLLRGKTPCQEIEMGSPSKRLVFYTMHRSMG